LFPHLPYPWEDLEGVLQNRPLLKKEKFFGKVWGTPSVTLGLRTGDTKKFESIRINLRDLAWSQVFPWNPI
jgi:hypothetical protein